VFIPVDAWFRAFLLTLLVEIPVATWLLRHREPDLRRAAALVVFANLVSHPIVWFALSQVFLVGSTEYVLAAESWAIAVETLFYAVAVQGLGLRRAAIVSLVANLASFVVGRLVIQVWPEVLR
jgi:hypothetical protein